MYIHTLHMSIYVQNVDLLQQKSLASVTVYRHTHRRQELIFRQWFDKTKSANNAGGHYDFAKSSYSYIAFAATFEFDETICNLAYILKDISAP